MNSDSFIHKELLRIYPEYSTINDPHLQLEFFSALPSTIQRALKASSVRAKGVGPNRILINDPVFNTQELCTPVEIDGSPCTATLATLISAYIDYYCLDQGSDRSRLSAQSTLDSQIIEAYYSWQRDIKRSSHIVLRGQTMEVVGFLSTDCLDNELCVFEVIDLYYFLLRRGESYAKSLFRTRFPLTHEVGTADDKFDEESSDKPTQVLISNIPLFADPETRAHTNMEHVLEQFVHLRKHFRLWLLAGLHAHILTLLDNSHVGIAGITNIPDVAILNQPFLPNDAADDADEVEENQNRLLILKDRTAATRLSLDTPWMSDIQSGQGEDTLGVLQSLQDQVTHYVDKEFDALCKLSIPLFPGGWA